MNFLKLFQVYLGGESIKEINRKSGAFVELDKTYIPPIGNSLDRQFRLRGTPEQIALAQQLMYEKIANSPGGAGDLLTPLQFQQQFNLPLIGSSHTDPWSGSADPYATDANGAAATDPYSLWASAYGQWAQGTMTISLLTKKMNYVLSVFQLILMIRLEQMVNHPQQMLQRWLRWIQPG